MHGLVAGYVLIESIRVFHRTVLHTRRTPRAFVLDNVAGLFGYGDRKVSRFAVYTIDFGIG